MRDGKKITGKAFQQTASLLAATLESTADGLLAIDNNGKVTVYNNKFISMCHIPGSLAAKKDDKILLENVLSQLKDPDDFIEKVKQLYSQPEANSFDLMEFKDGRVFERYSQPQKLGNETVGRVWSFRDVTDRRRAEEEQILNRETAERVAGETAVIAEIGRLIGSTMDIDEVYDRLAAEIKKLIPFDRLAVNLHNIHEENVKVVYVFGEAISGRSKGELFPLKGSVSEVIAKTRAGLYSYRAEGHETDQRFDNYASTVQEGLRSLMGVPLIYRDEVVGSLHFRSKIPNAYTERDLRVAEKIGVQIAGAIGTVKLFSDLKKTENSLRESEEQYRALVESANDIVFRTDSTGHFTFINPAALRITGYEAGEIIGSHYPTLIRQDKREEAIKLFGHQFVKKILNTYSEYPVIIKDGREIWLGQNTQLIFQDGKVTAFQAVARDITERKRMEEEIREMSLRDLLTGLYNRRGFITLAEQQIRTADRSRRTISLTFIDCDGLKLINDTLGHEEGDKALIDTADVLRQTVRKSDIIARLGGDEFAVLAIDAADINPDDFPKRLQQNIDAGNAKNVRPYKLSMSWGTSVYDPGSSRSLDELMSSADERMYAQKIGKSNRRN
jgi:diguanylate cyclase (GGDEF)-like protein/PAS domain S-box-containing protein